MNPFKVLSLKDGMHLKIISSASQNATWMIKIALPAAMSLIWTLMTDQQAAPRLRSNAPARRGVIVCVNLWKCCPPSRWFSVSAVAERSPSRSSGGFRHRVGMPNKDRPLVDRHAPKNGVGWLVNTQQGKVSQFRNDNPTSHAQWVVVETKKHSRRVLETSALWGSFFVYLFIASGNTKEHRNPCESNQQIKHFAWWG